jgi:hypothetical protein
MATTTNGITACAFFHGSLEGVHGCCAIATTRTRVFAGGKTERIAGSKRVVTSHRAKLATSNDRYDHCQEHGEHRRRFESGFEIRLLAFHGGVEAVEVGAVRLKTVRGSAHESWALLLGRSGSDCG